MRLRVYLETTIVSYLTALPSRDLVTAAHQQITRDWWETRRTEFDLFVSQPVTQEASAGDPDAVARRLTVLEKLALVAVSDEAVRFAAELVEEIPLPERAAVDALHIAIAVMNGMHYLLTWNCRHIANAALRVRITSICEARGYEVPVICTPEELLEE
jgi:hypothetical protein